MYCLVFFEATKNCATVELKNWESKWIPAQVLVKNGKLYTGNFFLLFFDEYILYI